MALCTIPGCTKKLLAKGACSAHYSKHRYSTDPAFKRQKVEATAAWRRDNPKKLKEINFRKTIKYRENPALRAEILTRQNDKYATDPEYRQRRKDYSRRQKGFCPALVAALRGHQQGACAICSVHLRLGRRAPCSEYADHDHKTNKARGLLCMICNTSLGFYEKHQRARGVLFAPYEAYLQAPPAALFAADGTPLID